MNIKEYHLSQNSEATPHFSEDSPSLPAFSPEIKTTTAITSLHTGQGLPMLDYHKHQSSIFRHTKNSPFHLCKTIKSTMTSVYSMVEEYNIFNTTSQMTKHKAAHLDGLKSMTHSWQGSIQHLHSFHPRCLVQAASTQTFHQCRQCYFTFPCKQHTNNTQLIVKTAGKIAGK